MPRSTLDIALLSFSAHRQETPFHPIPSVFPLAASIAPPAMLLCHSRLSRSAGSACGRTELARNNSLRRSRPVIRTSARTPADAATRRGSDSRELTRKLDCSQISAGPRARRKLALTPSPPVTALLEYIPTPSTHSVALLVLLDPFSVRSPFLPLLSSRILPLRTALITPSRPPIDHIPATRLPTSSPRRCEFDRNFESLLYTAVHLEEHSAYTLHAHRST